jgi:hypothetical protein
MADYEETQQYDEYYAEPQERNRTWLIVAVVVVAIILCCCCLALVAAFALPWEDILDELEVSGVLPALVGMTALV